jgi:hypothetical protein
MTVRRWYAIGRTVYAMRGTDEHNRDQIIALCASEACARHITTLHNTTLAATSRKQTAHA